MGLFSSQKKRPVQTWPTTGGKDNSQTVHQSLYTTQQDRRPQNQYAMPAKSSTWPVQGIKYKPLSSARKEIRVLRLHSGIDSDPVSCTMFHTSLALDKNPISTKNRIPYETISYCWGTNPGRAVIQLNGESVKVTGSAARVLHRMRLPKEDRVVWIDAICINQNDDHEKSGQVAMMGEIYQNTWHNLVWLGDDKGFAKNTKMALDAVLKNIRANTKDYKNFYKVTHDKSGLLCRNGSTFKKSVDTRSLGVLFSRRWFGRLWIAQEVALPPKTTCHFGAAEFSLCDMLRVAVWLLYNSKQVPELLENPGLWKATNLWSLADHQCVPLSVSSYSRSSLSDLYHLLRWMEAGEPRDNVFALLGIWNPQRSELKTQLVPKYSDSVENIFRDSTRVIIEESRTLVIMQEKSDDGMMRVNSGPSWAVRFDIKNANDNAARRLSWKFNANDGQWLRRDTMNSARNPDILSLHGIVVGVVIRRGSHIPSLFKNNAWPYIQEINKMVNLGSGKAKASVVNMALAKTLMCGHNWSGDAMLADDLEDFAAFSKYLDVTRANPSHEAHLSKGKVDELTRRASRCFDAVAQACWKRCFFVTSHGGFGLGPGGMAEGDLIVVLYGGPVPYVIRQARGGYRYIGACYAEGVMQGEAMRQHKAKKEKDNVFEVV